MNFIKISIISLILSACAYKPSPPPQPLVFHYSHPEHGVVSIPNEFHKKARKDCTSKVYAKGVLIDGVKVTDHEKINSYYYSAYKHKSSAVDAQLKDLIKSLNTFSGAAARYGAYDNKKKYTVPDDNGKYDEVDRAEKDIESCMSDLGWKKVD